MSTKTCPSCGAPIAADATECKYCGEKIAVEQAQYAPPQQMPYAPPQQQMPYAPPQQMPYAPPQQQTQYAPPQQMPYAQPQYAQSQTPPVAFTSSKSKIAAGLLAIFLGGLGIHKFYLGKPGIGILYLIFCWTFIPSIVGFIEGIIYLSSSDEKFYYKYVKK